MAWTTPKTWATNELVTADMMNEQLRDNLLYLLKPNHFRLGDNGSYTTTSTSYVNVNSSLSVAVESHDARFLVGFSGSLSYTPTSGGQAELAVGFDNGNEFLVARSTGAQVHVGGVTVIPAIPAGSHDIQIRFRVSGGTGTAQFAGNGTGMRIVFWALEL